jgi:hypothetical protein
VTAVGAETPPRSLAEQILSDDSRQARLLVARGLFPLPPVEKIPLQVAFARSDDAELAAAATEALGSSEPKILADVILESRDRELMAFFGQHSEHPVVLEAILRNPGVSPEILGLIAPRLDPELQEICLLRQDLIIDMPEILDRLEENPRLSAYAKRRLREYREHLIARPAPVEESIEVPAEEALQEPTDEEVQSAIAEARKIVAEGERDESTGLTDAQVRSLPVPVRLKLTRAAPKTLRSILVKDKNPLVAVSVLRGNALTESEVELIASNRSVVEEVLSTIARDRQWIRKYNIMLALVRNPRTPVGLAVRLTPRLSARDLRNLSRDRNISEAVRKNAGRLYRIKAV